MIRKWWSRWKAVSWTLRAIQEHNDRPNGRTRIRCPRKSLNDTYNRGGTEALEKDVELLRKMSDEEDEIGRTYEQILRWGIRLVVKRTDQVIGPCTSEVRRLRFSSSEEANIFLSRNFGERLLDELEWRVVDLVSAHQSLVR